MIKISKPANSDSDLYHAIAVDLPEIKVTYCGRKVMHWPNDRLTDTAAFVLNVRSCKHCCRAFQ